MSVLMITFIYDAQLTLQQERFFMLSHAEEIQLLQNLVRAIGAKKTLDIGNYVYSCIHMKFATSFCTF